MQSCLGSRFLDFGPEHENENLFSITFPLASRSIPLAKKAGWDNFLGLGDLGPRKGKIVAPGTSGFGALSEKKVPLSLSLFDLCKGRLF